MKTFSRRGTLPEQKTFSTYNVSGKRSVLNMSLAAHEIDQDLALITNQKRRRSSTRGGVIVIETLPEKLTKCVNVLLRLRHHKHAEYFNKPIKKAGWPEKAVDAYYNNTMSLSSSAEEEELDLSLIQARLANGEYETVFQFVKDVRRMFRDASSCAPPDSELANSAIIMWQSFEDLIRDGKIAKPQEVPLPWPSKRSNTHNHHNNSGGNVKEERGRSTRKSDLRECFRGGDNVDVSDGTNTAAGYEKKRFFVRIKENESEKEVNVKPINISTRADRV